MRSCCGASRPSVRAFVRAPVTYSNVLFIDLSPEGIGISILLPFRIFHPRLLIPWMAVDECRAEKFWLMTTTAVYLSQPKTRLLFGRRVGERVDDYWKRYRQTPDHLTT